MDQHQMEQHIQTAFPGVETQDAYGYRFFFVGAERMLPFATLASATSEHETASNLQRPGVYRLNLGVRRETFVRLFPPDAPGRHDFTALDVLMPHPEYAAQSWACVLNPGARTLTQALALLEEAYAIAAERARRKGTAPGT